MKAWQVSLGWCRSLCERCRWLAAPREERRERDKRKQHVSQAFLLCRRSPSLWTERRFSQQNVSVSLYLHRCCGRGSCIPHKIALMVKLNFWPAIRLQAIDGLSCLQNASEDALWTPAPGLGKGNWTQVTEDASFRQEANFTVTLSCVNADWKRQLRHARLAISCRITCQYLYFFWELKGISSSASYGKMIIAPMKLFAAGIWQWQNTASRYCSAMD